MKNTPLHSTFQHLKGISAQKEWDLWVGKIYTLQELSRMLGEQPSLFEDMLAPVCNCISELDDGNIESFVKGLPPSEYYRIAYSMPKDVMFLDIETTGLSVRYHYITLVGWMQNGKYDYWVQGTDASKFLGVFENTKIIVTFNGKLFDCRFLDKQFNTKVFSKKPQIDLRYLSRKYIKKRQKHGGQKEIEEITGFKRPAYITDVDGREAIVLWYKYLWGDSKAFEDLLIYNYFDILGMTFLLDFIYKQIAESHPVFSKLNTSWFYTGERIPQIESPQPEQADKIRKYVETKISWLKNQHLNRAHKFTIIGIDLSGKEDNNTGVCCLRGNNAQTKIIHDTKDIIEYVYNNNPDIVSIDAPLSIPYGRTSVFDDDPQREFGIMRQCERILKRRGVNAYPALIKSMQLLTLRGMQLAQNFRKNGIPVIECFPGAAQDILQLPRKRTNEDILKQGLIRFGIHGDYEKTDIAHDELDAITAAIVAQLFIEGYYEAVGNKDEGYLIIPKLEKKNVVKKVIIGICGPIAAGKTTVARHLEKNGMYYIRYSQILQEHLEQLDIAANREHLQEYGYEVFSQKGQYWLNSLLFEKLEDKQFIVIDGMRHPEDFTFWKEKYYNEFVLLNIDTDFEVCKKRYPETGNSYEVVVNQPVEANIPILQKKADYVVNNNGDFSDTINVVDNILKKYME